MSDTQSFGISCSSSMKGGMEYKFGLIPIHRSIISRYFVTNGPRILHGLLSLWIKLSVMTQQVVTSLNYRGFRFAEFRNFASLCSHIISLIIIFGNLDFYYIT